MKPSLYGITHSNRNFSDPFYWGKNQFNSSFPVALACYMRDCKTPAVYLRHGKGKNTYVDTISFLY
ncbi:MAG: HindVP family restriction endonuclease, partial [Victivallales bacterium]|nr:HindVP family restriction endonuclease [Victivallales bacterium]